MKVESNTDTMAEEVKDGCEGVNVRWVISEKDGAFNFHMRVFSVAPGGHTHHHSHPWEHEVFILQGSGAVGSVDGDKPFQQGDVVFILPEEEHVFKNTGDEEVKFICVIPAQNMCAG